MEKRNRYLEHGQPMEHTEQKFYSTKTILFLFYPIIFNNKRSVGHMKQIYM